MRPKSTYRALRISFYQVDQVLWSSAVGFFQTQSEEGGDRAPTATLRAHDPTRRTTLRPWLPPLKSFKIWQITPRAHDISCGCPFRIRPFCNDYAVSAAAHVTGKNDVDLPPIMTRKSKKFSKCRRAVKIQIVLRVVVTHPVHMGRGRRLSQTSIFKRLKRPSPWRSWGGARSPPPRSRRRRSLGCSPPSAWWRSWGRAAVSCISQVYY